MQYVVYPFLLLWYKLKPKSMRDRLYVSSGDCFQVDKHSFGIAETLSGYTLYSSISCASTDEGKKAWADAGGNVPDGWKAVSDAIPANTQHLVYDNIAGSIYFLKDCTDATIYLRW